MHSMSRRNFLGSMAVFSAMGMSPRFLTEAVADEARAIEGFADDRVLVVVQLGGGNDGLNTIVPYSNDVYHRLRPQLGLREKQVLRMTDEAGMNAKLVDLMRLYDAGQLGVVQGVGYPNPDRSHFRSMEIWQTASEADEYLGHGWIGRYFDNTCSGAARPQAGMAIGNERPQAFDGAKGFGIATDDPHRFGWNAGSAGDTEDVFRALNQERPAANDTLSFLRHTTTHAISSSHEVQRAAERGGVQQGIGRGRNAKQLEVVAGLIRGGLSTRIYYVSLGGFDTHAGQLNQHDRLLQGVGEGLARFQQQLERDGTADRVLTMVFSEFGRRVEENASGRTDHGTAAPLFLLGNHVRPGVHGQMPDLGNLDNGDMRHTTDFRSVYATVLQDWFRTPAAPVLGRDFATLGLLA
jgi:uncharacterized protein (DUF1501 family)